jgi:hypothetical protein
MPTVFRFLVSLLIIVAVFAAIVIYLGNFVEPNTREMTIRLPPSRLDPKPVATPTPTPPPAPPADAVEGDSVAGTGSPSP